MTDNIANAKDLAIEVARERIAELINERDSALARLSAHMPTDAQPVAHSSAVSGEVPSLARAAEEVRNDKGGRLYYSAAGGFSIIPNRKDRHDIR
jgi:hypothetical protein